MQQLLDIHFNFLCRTTRKTKNGENPIILRIIFRSQRRDIYTGLSCDTDDWDYQAKKLKKTYRAASTVNKNLDHILRKAMDAYDNLRFSETVFSIEVPALCI